MSQFPAATKTFTVYRRNQVDANGNPVDPRSVAPISTGESIALKDSAGDIVNGKGVVVFSGTYIGSTFTTTPIILGDLLDDETENNIAGKPVSYEVMGKTIYNPIYAELHIKRTDIGA
jgi:hypothetical protein